MLKQSLMLVLTATLAGGAWAKPPQPTDGERYLDNLSACRTLADRSERLTCYDRIAEQLDEARKKDEITLLSRRQIEERRRSGFGLSSDGSSPFTARDQPMSRIENLDTSVTKVASAGRGVFQVTLADGSVWRTTEIARFDPVVGDPVHIRRGALGSFLASFKGARSVRVQRLR